MYILCPLLSASFLQFRTNFHFVLSKFVDIMLMVQHRKPTAPHLAAAAATAAAALTATQPL
jgi:hypothetical protein